MGYYVQYVIDCDLSDVLSRIDSESKEHYLSRADEDKIGLLDANLKGTELDVHIDADVLTILSVAQVNWSWLIREVPCAINTIEKYDQAVLRLFECFDVLRVDEMMVDDWEALPRELRGADEQGFSNFKQWLQSQEKMYWCFLRSSI